MFPVIQRHVAEHLVCAKHCSRSLGYISEQNRQKPLSSWIFYFVKRRKHQGPEKEQPVKRRKIKGMHGACHQPPEETTSGRRSAQQQQMLVRGLLRPKLRTDHRFSDVDASNLTLNKNCFVVEKREKLE